MGAGRGIKFAIALLCAATEAFAQVPAAGSRTETSPLVNQRVMRVLETFRANPEGLLTRNPNGGGALAAQVRDILIADKTQLEAIFKLLPVATAAQQEAFGVGLALARLLSIRDTEFTNNVQTRVVVLNNRNVLIGYSLFGGGGVAAIASPSAPPSTPAITFGPVGPVAGAPSAYSQGRLGSGGGDGSGADLSGGVSGRVVGPSSARNALGATPASPSGTP